MAQTSAVTSARRALLAMLVFTLALTGLMLGAAQWSDGRVLPRLGLDLEGGTQLVLEPRLTGSQSVNADQINQARDIIVQRVDAGGVTGAEVTTQGGRNIVVAIPGSPTESTLNAIRRSSQMQFRPVLVEGLGTPQPTLEPSAEPSAQPSPDASTNPPADAPADAAAEAAPSADASPDPGATQGSPTPDATSPSPEPAAPTDTPSDPMSLEWVTPEVQARFAGLDCTDTKAVDGIVDDPDKPLVTCDQSGQLKYILGPVVVAGSEIKDAAAGYQPLPNGQMSTTVEIQLTLKSEGAKQYADISRKMVPLPEPQNQLAATLDSKVIVAPRFNEAILDGRASITGGFTIQSARDLAQQLKFGALPISFDLQTREQISPTLGSEQLRYGFIAGLIGMGLVVLYSLMQYRLLGMVVIGSIVFAALLTYLSITILGWSHNYRLDMAGVTGLIIAIGFTADSFIVYFERIRDELRAGRSLESAVAQGWNRAKRTILIADGVNFLAAAVLWLLASSSVRGFAFTLGLTTLLDILIVFYFSHPLVALLARRKFFRDGHRWSGLDPSTLGVDRDRLYAGRGRWVARPDRVATTEGSSR